MAPLLRLGAVRDQHGPAHREPGEVDELRRPGARHLLLEDDLLDAASRRARRRPPARRRRTSRPRQSCRCQRLAVGDPLLRVRRARGPADSPPARRAARRGSAPPQAVYDRFIGARSLREYSGRVPARTTRPAAIPRSTRRCVASCGRRCRSRCCRAPGPACRSGDRPPRRRRRRTRSPPDRPTSSSFPFRMRLGEATCREALDRLLLLRRVGHDGAEPCRPEVGLDGRGRGSALASRRTRRRAGSGAQARAGSAACAG